MPTMTKGPKGGEAEPVLGVPYGYAAPPPYQVGVAQPPQQVFYVGQNPYQAGMIPPNAVFGDPKGVPLQQTMYRDTPAPFQCVYCGSSGLTTIKSKPSLAAGVACMMSLGVGFCFLCPCTDCLWHKYHYCPNCGQKVADFKKSDPCMVVDMPRWHEESFALPA